jgi:hypothetical protein
MLPDAVCVPVLPLYLLQELLGKHQRELAERDAALISSREELSSLRSQHAHAVAERSIAAAAEARASAALRDAVSDRDRYARLVDSLQSLEAGAAGRAAAERASAEDERTRLQVS